MLHLFLSMPNGVQKANIDKGRDGYNLLLLGEHSPVKGLVSQKKIYIQSRNVIVSIAIATHPDNISHTDL